ncbi:pseudouridine synthase, partial [Acinetobacter baumannii]
GLDDLVPVHRIDRETAGLVLCSLDPATRDAYTALFRTRDISKTYEAVASWRADLPLPHVHRSRLVEGEPFFRMREAEGAANSETHVA